MSARPGGTTLSDWIVGLLADESNKPEPSIGRLVNLSAALRDVEVAAAASAVRLNADKVGDAIVRLVADAAGYMGKAGSFLGGFGVGPSVPPLPLPCHKCGTPAVLERVIDGQSFRVCLDHVDD